MLFLDTIKVLNVFYSIIIIIIIIILVVVVVGHNYQAKIFNIMKDI